MAMFDLTGKVAVVTGGGTGKARSHGRRTRPRLEA
jgi:hypothetical protein